MRDESLRSSFYRLQWQLYGVSLSLTSAHEKLEELSKLLLQFEEQLCEFDLAELCAVANDRLKADIEASAAKHAAEISKSFSTAKAEQKQIADIWQTAAAHQTWFYRLYRSSGTAPTLDEEVERRIKLKQEAQHGLQ